MIVAPRLPASSRSVIMIPSSLPAGIPNEGSCTDCSTASPLPGIEAGQGAFQRVLHTLLGGVEVKATAALPMPGAMAGEAGWPGEQLDAGVAACLRLATQSTDGRAGAQDPDAVEAARAADSPAGVAEQTAVSALFGAGQPLPQPAAAAVMLPEPAPSGAQGLVAGQGAAATLAGGRQQLPSLLPVQLTDAQPVQLASVSGQVEAEAVLSPSVMADVTVRPVQHTQQPAPDPQVLLAPERPFDPARPAATREILSMQVPLRAQGWDNELAQRIVWMAGRQTQWAEISLTPPNLGHLEIHLSIKGIEASAWFYSPHAAVREAIDDSLPRLREMLAGAGINLGQTQVSQESFADRRGEEGMRYVASGEAGVGPGALPPIRSGRGLVDLYV